ncbi:uncharacterized protein K452DRAFT_301174 [Aplosporella prunicola CBS 121167]|uniref:Uncharacterized protein n=1 Tax=Aplosporella prunicola CBS 121167 TaxID=1176127 RepID=A0A6A6B3N1_9PEZI|nr:uncharacterized protein K452DRAFT_301174 [Aplosporella prunicola CBS 121167]KAF2138208.1 hypothetical protein K452DRAFT_301174 [Aplosporella prunicola CBS 121167]
MQFLSILALLVVSATAAPVATPLNVNPIPTLAFTPITTPIATPTATPTATPDTFSPNAMASDCITSCDQCNSYCASFDATFHGTCNPSSRQEGCFACACLI